MTTDLFRGASWGGPTGHDLVANLDRRRAARLANAPARPANYKPPRYLDPAYQQHRHWNWITDEEHAEIERAYVIRAERARAGLGTFASPPRRWRRGEPKDSRQYVNPMATTAARDNRLTPQAKALLQVIRARCGNTMETRTTKTTLGATMSRCARSIQRYIQELVLFGYIAVEIRRNERGSHTGLIVRLCQKVLPFWKDDRGLAQWLHEVDEKLPNPFNFTTKDMTHCPQLFDFTGRTEMSPKNYSPNLNIIIGQWAPLLAYMWKRRKT